MFARTRRLTLRPGWPEDARALATAIGHRSVIDKLARVPWPYAEADAATYLATPRGERDAIFVIDSHDDDEGGRSAPRLVGGIGLHGEGRTFELGYWLTPAAWGRGYATEAGRAVLAIAEHALGLDRLDATHALDNPASGAVLRKLGFRVTGETMRHSLGRGCEVASTVLEWRAGG